MSLNTITLKLKYPVESDGVQVTELTFRRFKGRDLKDMSKKPTGMEQTFFLIHRLAGVPPEFPDEMDGEDIDAASRIIEGFLERRR